MSTINNLNANTPVSTANSNTSTPKTVPAGGQPLTQADFLKIMVAQFTQQNPLASGDGSSGSGTSDYVNQLMSMTNLTTLQTLSGQEAQGLAVQLPGDTVTIDDNGAFSTGKVTSARVNGADGAVYFTVGGKEYPTSDLYSIAAPATTPTTTPTTP